MKKIILNVTLMNRPTSFLQSAFCCIRSRCCHIYMHKMCKLTNCLVTCKAAGQEIYLQSLRWHRPQIRVSFYSAPSLWPWQPQCWKDTLSCHDKQKLIAHYTQSCRTIFCQRATNPSMHPFSTPYPVILNKNIKTV